MSSRNSPFERIERMVEQLSGQMEGRGRPWERSMPGLAGQHAGETGVDLVEEDDEFVVAVDLPGFEREDVDLRLIGDQLQVDAVRERSVESEEGTMLRQERRRDAVQRRVQLPQPVDGEATSADLQNGVLTVHLPKAEPEDRGEHIQID